MPSTGSNITKQALIAGALRIIGEAEFRLFNVNYSQRLRSVQKMV